MQLASLVTILICNVGGPGTSAQAQPVLAQFLRHLEISAGLPAQTFDGVYAKREAACSAHFAKKRPAMVVSDLPTYLAKRKSWKLSALAQMGGHQAKRYYLLVREGHKGGLKGLEGSLVVGPAARNPRFVTRLLLGNKVSPGYFRLVYTPRPLRALRKVARKGASAAIVDQRAFQYLPQLKLPSKLVTLHRSPALPGLTLSIVQNARYPRGLAKKIKKALPRLCEGKGKSLCRTFGIKAFHPINRPSITRLHKAYR